MTGRVLPEIQVSGTRSVTKHNFWLPAESDIDLKSEKDVNFLWNQFHEYFRKIDFTKKKFK